MGMFDNLEKNEGAIAPQEDKIGGFAKVDHTGRYKFTIEKAYAGVSSGGAFSVTVHFKTKEGAFFTMTEYITSGTKKGCKNYYLDKDGNKQYLPGYNKIKALDSLLGNDRDYPATEKKSLMIWDRDASKEMPTEKEAITSWFGKEVDGLVMKILEDKQVNDGAGKYVPTTESRELYEVQHFLDPVTGATRNEKTLGKTGFVDKWLLANPKDKVMDKRKMSKGSTGSGSTPEDTDDNPFQ